MTGGSFRATFLSVINVKCNACGGESQFEEATAEQEQPCPLCHEMLKVTPTKSAAELSEEEQMAQYEEALKETGAINPVSQALGQAPGAPVFSS